MVTLQIVKSLRFGELAVNTNSPIFSVVKLWKVSPNFMLHNVDLILYSFISHVSWKLNIIEHT